MDIVDPLLALESLGQQIDAASGAQDRPALQEAIAVGQNLLGAELHPEFRATAHYFLANAWDGMRLVARGQDFSAWEQPELEQEVLHLRFAAQGVLTDEVSPTRSGQILTNLGNMLSFVGRPVEAIECWDRALARVPGFPMALGNRGHGLEAYARLLHDSGHQAVVLREAYQDLRRALQFELYPQASRHFAGVADRIAAALDPVFLESGVELDDFPLGECSEEIAYRQWCLRQRLFLNPLNDLGPSAIAAADVLMLPDMVTGIDEGPGSAGLFNQLKQEFVSARFLFYEGVTSTEPHFADRDVTLVNTLDYPCYSLAVEKMKAAFRMAYSLFDKVAFFLNHYLKLGHPPRSISFKTIWYEKRDRHRGISPAIESLGNYLLRGLFWLSKDLSEGRSGFADAIEPDARDIEELRQHAEHRYLKVHMYPPREVPDDPGMSSLQDSLARSVTRMDLERRVMRMLSLARAAMIYLSAAVHVEEARRASLRPKDGLVMPILMDRWEDRWKY